MAWWQIVLIILTSIVLGVIIGALLSYQIVRLLRKPPVKKRETTSVVEAQLKHGAADLLSKVKNNLVMMTEAQMGRPIGPVMIDNPLAMNNWKIKKFLEAVLVVQLAMLSLVGLGALGIDIPILRQIVGFIYLIFIPGIIILRIFRLYRLSSLETLLYSVGLSLAFSMFLGFFMNMLYPVIGFERPISTLPLIITWTVVLGLLCFIAYKRDKGFSVSSRFDAGELLSPPVLFLILLPLLAVIGTQVVNYYANNVLLLILIALIAVAALIMMLTNLIQVRFYPLAVFSISLAVLWHSSLISRYLTGWDIFTEYHFYSLVAQSGFWDLTVPHTYNAMLSVTILPAVFSHLLDMGGEEVFKFVYPVLYALVPLTLYRVYGKQLNSKQAFSAVFFFMAIWIFYLVMPSLARQMIAELFFVLLIMVVMDREATASKKALFIVFGASLVVSHYSLSYIVMAFLILSLITLHLLREKKIQVTNYSVLLFIVICLTWYMYISSSVPLGSAVSIGQHIYQSFNVEFLNPFSRSASVALTGTSPNVLHFANRILYYLVLLLMAIGAFKVVSRVMQKESPKEYLTFAIGSYILLAACIIVPFFSEQLGTERMFHLAAIVLAPFFILGAEAIVDALSSLARSITHFTSRLDAKKIVTSIMLVLLFLFDSGFAFEVAHNPWLNSPPLSLVSIENQERDVYLEQKISLRYQCPTEQEVLGARWLDQRMDRGQFVYATYYDIRVPALTAYGPQGRTVPLIPPPHGEVKGGYIYLGYVNIVFGYGVTNRVFLPDPTHGIDIWDIRQISPVMDSSIKLYTNGATEIYWSPW